MLEIVFSDSEKLLLERSNLFNKEYFKFNISIIYGKT